MNVSESVTPAELEPEPDSPVPIRMARRHGERHACQTSVTKESSPGCSKIARDGNTQGPVGWLGSNGMQLSRKRTPAGAARHSQRRSTSAPRRDRVLARSLPAQHVASAFLEVQSPLRSIQLFSHVCAIQSMVLSLWLAHSLRPERPFAEAAQQSSPVEALAVRSPLQSAARTHGGASWSIRSFCKTPSNR